MKGNIYFPTWPHQQEWKLWATKELDTKARLEKQNRKTINLLLVNHTHLFLYFKNLQGIYQ